MNRNATKMYKNASQPYICVLLDDRDKVKPRVTFFATAKIPSSPAERDGASFKRAHSRLIGVRKLPPFYSLKVDAEEKKYVGIIEFNGESRILSAPSYFPKDGAREVPCLGYYLEAVSVHLLEKHLPFDFVTIRKTDKPDPDTRLEKAAAVGLEYEVLYTPSDWKRGLGKGILYGANMHEFRMQGICEKLIL